MIGRTVILTGFIPARQGWHWTDPGGAYLHFINPFDQPCILEIRAIEPWEKEPKLFGNFRIRRTK